MDLTEANSVDLVAAIQYVAGKVVHPENRDAQALVRMGWATLRPAAYGSMLTVVPTRLGKTALAVGHIVNALVEAEADGGHGAGVHCAG
jgi:hypothetical protein